jgi:hypothetical protein
VTTVNARRLPRAAVVAVVAVVTAACSGSAASTATEPRRSGPAVAHGTARLDGRRFDARWIGAVVRRDALITPCQAELSRIRDGRFGVTVFGAGQAGCGGPGTSVRFWTFRDEQIFNDRWVPWSRLAAPVALRFSTADPDAGVPVRTELSGRVFDADGRRVPLGTRIEAHIGATTCGVASVRAGGGFRGYIMNVVGPDAIPACVAGATISFLVGEQPAVETAVNGRSERGLFRLTVRGPA